MLLVSFSFSYLCIYKTNKQNPKKTPNTLPSDTLKVLMAFVLTVFSGWSMFFMFTQEFTKGKFAANITVNQLADYLTGLSKIFLCIDCNNRHGIMQL